MLTVLGLVLGLVGLFFGGNWLVKGASLLARSIGISPLVVGLTVVALGTSTPELLVSVSAALQGSPDIAIGNVLGSSIANIGLILGISGLIYPISVSVPLVKRQIPIMIIVSLAVVAMFQDQQVSRIDGTLLIIGLLAFISYTIYGSLRDDKAYDTQSKTSLDVNRLKEGGRLVLGIIVLMIGSQLTVTNATELARNFGISELVIGVTLIAVGTSLPELITSVIAAMRQESDIAIGNVVGSNIFNLLGILGVTALVEPINVSRQVLTVDAVVMVGFTLLVLPFVLDRKLNRPEAAFFLIAYAAFTYYAVTAG
ncbi:MAG: calcium/sodium antiporter [Phototrophicaceae bacterium]